MTLPFHIFTPSELQLPYQEWIKLVGEIESRLSIRDRRWLNDFNSWDLACSPMSDEKRRYIRFGWYLGYDKGHEWAYHDGYEDGYADGKME